MVWESVSTNVWECTECLVFYQIVQVSPPNNMKGFVSLAVSSSVLFFSDICQLNKCPFCQWSTSVQWPLFIHFHISPPSFRHSRPPPPRWMWHCVCACHKRRAADRKGVPRTVTMAQVRTSFCSEWKHPECLMDKDQSQAENVCHTACESIWLPSAPLLPSHVEQRTQTGAEGAVCNRVPEGFGSNIQTCVCTVVLHVLHCSFF